MKPLNLIVAGILVGSFSSSGIAVAQSVPATEVVNNRASAPIKGQYIVVFKDTVKDPRAEVASLNRGGIMRVKHVYTNALKGFAAEIPDVVVNALKNNPRISYIEQDQVAHITATTTQVSPPSWGLDRIDQQQIVSATKQYNYTYDGTGVYAYVIDSGISAHSEFVGRLLGGVGAVSGESGSADCNGHGTHVAGTIGGTTTGVAKDVWLVPVRVLNCSGSGSYSDVIAGVNWVVADVTATQPKKKAVANMSLGGPRSTALDSAVDAAVSSGVVFAVAAGNSSANACNYSPARAANALTVGATTSSDKRSSFSNFGSCLDIFAPGSNITSSVMGGGYEAWNGTSMATPHVAGAVALLLEEGITPENVRNQLIADGPAISGLNKNGTNEFLNTNYFRTK